MRQTCVHLGKTSIPALSHARRFGSVKVAREVAPVQEAGPSRAASAVSRENRKRRPRQARESGRLRLFDDLRRRARCAASRFVLATAACSSISKMERGVDGAVTGCALPETLINVVRLSHEGRREEAHDLFDAHLPLVPYEQHQGVGLATRKYVMMRRGISLPTRSESAAPVLARPRYRLSPRASRATRRARRRNRRCGDG
jgi:hypothetical protein